MAQRPRILVVDDDLTERDEAVGALRAAGYVVAACGTVPVAEGMAATFRPDLAVLEMVLGGEVVGPDLARRIRADADSLLLFVTGATRDETGSLRSRQGPTTTSANRSWVTSCWPACTHCCAGAAG
jgi:DNA-binding response OmpR family regulator